MIKLTVAILVVSSVVYACKVKQQSNLSPEMKPKSVFTQENDADIVHLLAKNWVINVVNYQADARKNVLYERGIDANLHDFSKESFQLTSDEKVIYTDGAGKKHRGTWELENESTQLVMKFEDGEEISWDIIKRDKNHLDLHLAIDARKIEWNVEDLDKIDIPTAVVFAGSNAGVVDEDTQSVNVTYRMMPRS